MLKLAWILAFLSAAPAVAAPVSVLIAGDGSLAVFDNATQGIAIDLQSDGAGQITRLSASARGAQAATLDHVLAAVASMRPLPGQGCFVFATSHGGKHEGLYLSDGDIFLTPRALDAALLKGCGAAPTVVVISACYSGSFAQPPMARANRVILTAARPDRSSFGCSAGRSYTVYDACLLKAWRPGVAWRTVYATVQGCVRMEETIERARASGPQGWFGGEVGAAVVP